LFRDALARRKRTQGDDHPLTLAAMNALADVLAATGKLQDAESLHRDTLERRRRVLGEEHRDTLTSMNNYATVLNSLGRVDEAETLHERTLATRRRVLGESHPHTLVSMNNYADVLRTRGKHAQAEPFAAELYRKAQAAQIPPGIAAIYMSHYGPCLVALTRFDEAEAPLVEAIRRFRAADQSTDARMRALLTGLADVYEHKNQREQADELRAEAQRLPPGRAGSTQPAAKS
jgi:tetratricopeptide (TPR) repeat protein